MAVLAPWVYYACTGCAALARRAELSLLGLTRLQCATLTACGGPANSLAATAAHATVAGCLAAAVPRAPLTLSPTLSPTLALALTLALPLALTLALPLALTLALALTLTLTLTLTLA